MPTTGWNTMPRLEMPDTVRTSASLASACSVATWAASTAATSASYGSALCLLGAVPRTAPSSARKRSATRPAVVRSTQWSAAPLWRMARWNSPAAAGDPSRAPTLMAPADSPATVMLAGSPPNEAMWSRTQRSAATWSARAALPVARRPASSRCR